MDPATAFLTASGVSTLGHLIGAGMSGSAADKANRQNAELQREFAQMGLRWKVEDAKLAGLHPTAVLGAQGYTAAPSYLGDNSAAQAASGIGQDISRAVMATATSQEREIHELTKERMGLENAILGQDLKARLNPNPPMPGTTHLVRPVPASPLVQRPDSPGQEPGSIADYGYARSGDEWFVIPSKDIKERTEDNPAQEIAWALRNQAKPLIKAPPPPDAPLMPGRRWHWTGYSYVQVIPKGTRTPTPGPQRTSTHTPVPTRTPYRR